MLRPAAVVTSGLRHSVRGAKVLDGVNLRVPVGARLLLVSEPDDAASALLRILVGLVRPSGGSFDLAGVPRSDEADAGWRRRIGYVGGEQGFYPWLSPREILDLAGRLADYDRAERRRRIDAAIEQYRLGPGLDKPVSRGGPPLAQRVALAAAMLTDPEVLLLDDPLRSLDAAERLRLLAVPGRRRTVVLASRYPASEDGLVDQVALLLNGRLNIHARRAELADRGLPLTLRGIASLAVMRAPACPAGGGRVRRFGTVTGLALRELWISFRLLLVVGVLVAAAVPSAMLPHTTPALAASPLESPLEWFAIGLALALGVVGGMAGAALSRERRRGSAGWLVIRAVPRAVILLGWFAAFVLLLVAGLLPAATLVWLTVAAPASDVGDAWPFLAPLIGAWAAGAAAVAIGLLLGTLLTPWPAGLLTMLVTAGLLLSPWSGSPRSFPPPRPPPRAWRSWATCPTRRGPLATRCVPAAARWWSRPWR